MIQQGATWDKALIAKLGVSEQVGCDHCGAPRVTFDHLWDCPALQAERDQAINEHLPGLHVDALHPAIRFGIAPAMSVSHNHSFWGSTVDGLSDAFKTLTGARTTLCTEHGDDRRPTITTPQDASIQTICAINTSHGHVNDDSDGEDDNPVKLTAHQVVAHL